MESGKIGIEEAIERYEEAMALHTHCQAILDQAELRIKKIHADSSGKLTVEAFEPTGTTEPE
jgi:exodeoxyribonuclease VII small subunit